MKNLRQMLLRAGWSRANKRKARPQSDSKRRRLSSQVLEKRELLAGDIAIMHNDFRPLDVNNDREVTTLDALIGINQLAQVAEGEPLATEGMFLDVNKDGQLTANDPLMVINALGSPEAQIDPIVELLLSARDFDDNLLSVENDKIAVGTGIDNAFNLEVSYNDLRTLGEDIGVFQLFVDITANNPGVLKTVMNETQRVTFSEEVRDATTGQFVFSLEGDPGNTFDSPIDFFIDDPATEISLALQQFGYTTDQFSLTRLDFGNNDVGYEIRYTDLDAHGNTDRPNIVVTQENIDQTITVTFDEFAFDDPNSVRFNINAFSRTFNNNSEFYGNLNRGSFTTTGFEETGGVGGVPTGGGGIPELSTDDDLIEPFDAFSLRVFLDQPGMLDINVNPGESAENMLVYGLNDPLIPDEILTQDLDSPRSRPLQDTVFRNGDDATLSFNADGGSNTAPVVSGPVTATFDERDPQGTVNLLDNASDDDGDTLTVTGLTPVSGDLSGISVNGNIVTVTPSAYASLNTGQMEEIRYSYSVSDGIASVPQTATITIDGFTQNTPPVVSGPISETRTEDDAAFFVDLRANATDADGDTLTANNIQLTSGDNRGITIAANGLSVNPSAYGDILDNGQNAVVNYTFVVTDGINAPVSSSAQITITGITDGGSNTAPVLSISPLTASFNEDDSPGTVNLLQGASDDDGDTLNVVNFNRVSGDDSGFSRSGNTLNVTPNAYNGLPAGENEVVVYSYQVSDGTANVNQTVTVTIDGLNDAPTVSAAINRVFETDNPVATVDLLGNASDVDGDTLSVTSLTNTGGNDGGITTNGTTISVNPSFYESLLAEGATETVTYTYTVDDGNSGTANTSATISITRMEVNDAPVLSISPLTRSVTEDDGVISLNLLQGASDPEGDTLSFTTPAVNGDPLGGINTNGNVTLNTNAYNSLSVGDSQLISLNYNVTDGNGGSTPQSFTITVNGVNDGPSVSSAITANFNDNDADTSISLLQFASDPDSGDSLNVANQRVVSGDGRGVMVNGNNLDISPSAYDALLGEGQSETIVIGFDVVDGNGGSVPQTATVRIDGEPVGVTVSGLIYIDEIGGDDTRNGVKDADEEGLGGVDVHLLPNAGGARMTTITDAFGVYSFDGVSSGSYTVQFDLPESAVVVGGTVSTVSVGDSAPAPLVKRVLGFRGTLGTIDIIASTYLNGNGPVGNSFEGAKFGLNGVGQDLFVLLDGWSGTEFAEFTLNSERDAALLSIVDSSGIVHTALVGDDDFVVSSDGKAAVLMGGFSNFDFSRSVDEALAEFPGFGNATEDYLGDRNGN